MTKVACIVRLLIFSVLFDFIISDDRSIANKRRYTRRHFLNRSAGQRLKNGMVGEYCRSNADCENSDCRGQICGGRPEGGWCKDDDYCRDKNCYRSMCCKKDAYKAKGDACIHERECLSTRCYNGHCVGRANGEWCHGEEWCASHHCYKSRCVEGSFDPCSVNLSPATCNKDCAWSNGRCSYSETFVWCGSHQAPSCDLCPSGHGATWCSGNCIWYEESCMAVSELPDPCIAMTDERSCIGQGECNWFDGNCMSSDLAPTSPPTPNPTPHPTVECTASNDCRQHYWCDNYHCKPLGQISESCKKDEACFSSMCQDGSCVECRTSNDCSDSGVNRCYNYQCKHLGKISESCKNDEGCLSSVCQDGSCVECRTSNDCSDSGDMACRNNQCRKWVPFVDSSKYVWSRKFSDENGYSSWLIGAIAGIHCSDRYCDNKELLYNHEHMFVPNSDPSRYWLGWFSEEQVGSKCHVTDNQAYVSEIQCRGHYCDDMRLHCQHLNPQLYKTDTSAAIYRTSPFSEEHGTQKCPQGYFLIGLQCHGRYCDDIVLVCRKVLRLETS